MGQADIEVCEACAARLCPPRWKVERDTYRDEEGDVTR